ncbi:MAG TPA: glycosyltransferase family 2 protein [Thermoanaerobaculia bacterium]
MTIVLVTWNSARYLPRCLEGILQQTQRDSELLVVDNASADDSVAILAPHATRIIRNDSNRGFSAAVNQAIGVANGELLLVVNPDCYLLPEYIERVAKMFDDPTVGSATGKLIRARGYEIEPTNEIDSMGIRMTRTGRHLDLHQGKRDEVIANPFEVFGVSGAAAMFRTSFLRDVTIDGEALDEDFFAYREDADLAWRGRVLGWRSMCEPNAVAYHVRRVTPEARRELPSDVNMHSVKNRFLLRLKNEGLYLALRNAPFELARDLVVIVAALTIERTSLPAFPWLWKNRRRVLAKRREIQRRRKVRDHELARWFR